MNQYAISFILKGPNNWAFSYLKSLLSRSNHTDLEKERESLKSDLSSLFPLEIKKKKSHKIPNLDGIVKSGRKEWNEANLWSLSKFLFLLPTGFISIHMLAMWFWATDWSSWTFELCMHKRFKWNKEMNFCALSSTPSKEFKNNFLALLTGFLLCPLLLYVYIYIWGT